MKVALVLGARPQIIKSALLIHLANRRRDIQLDVIHTGQHYDYEMTRLFFEELNLPEPLVNLNVGSGTHAQQTARIMTRLERVLRRLMPDLVVVPGDTNSTLAGALTAVKLHIPVGHVEAGARSYDMRMPEEVNRRLTDHCSTLLFAPTMNCVGNLKSEGLPEDRIHLTGDTMYDVLLQQLPRVEGADILQTLNLEPRGYVFVTVHRPENVDSPKNLGGIVQALLELKPLVVVFPAHPRTRKRLRRFRWLRKLEGQEHIRLIEPVSHQEALKLVKEARAVLTDSGGLQKEAFWLKTPCITLRQSTEWVETVQLGGNRLTTPNREGIVRSVREVLEREDEIRAGLRGTHL